MKSDPDRARRTQEALQAEGLDAVVCAFPKNVLLLTGYWPMIGNSIAIADREGRTTLLVPEDERDYIRETNADDILTFKAGQSGIEEIKKPLQPLLEKRDYGKIGIEYGPLSQEASYVAMTLYGSSLGELVYEIVPNAECVRADRFLNDERALLTTLEQEHVRTATAIAKEAFEPGRTMLREGRSEWELAQHFEATLSTAAKNSTDVIRARGIVSCMSGARAAKAYGAFAMSSAKTVNREETILIHANSQANGFWTDITRTYFIGEMPEQISTMYNATFAASERAMASIKPGVSAAEIDRIVRENLAEYGFEQQIKHSSGHGVGYSAIDHTAFPRLEKHSLDILQDGMVMNIEPGIYFEGLGGMRLCDMVLVTDNGAELLTPFHRTINELHVNN